MTRSNSRSLESGSSYTLTDGTQDNVPSEAPKLEAKDGFSLCPGCKEVVYCSSTCQQISTTNYHEVTCDVNLDHWVRETIPHHELPGLPDPHEQRITLLLLLRILSHLQKQPHHPLDHPWLQTLPTDFEEPSSRRSSYTYGRVRLQDCLPDLYDDSGLPQAPYPGGLDEPTDYLIPWSFETNVRKPFHMLLQLGGPQLAINSNHYDGWILNTMLARIRENVLISYGPRFEKAFKHDGTLLSQCTLPRREVVNQAVFREEGMRVMGADFDEVRWRERQMWSGSLYQLASLVQVAQEDEVANVVFFERNGTMVCRPRLMADSARTDSVHDIVHNGNVNGANGASAANECSRKDIVPIKAGDVLLREKEIRPLKCEGDCVDVDVDVDVADESFDMSWDGSENSDCRELLMRDGEREGDGDGDVEGDDEEMLEDGEIA